MTGKPEPSFVFYDPSGRRWSQFSRAMRVTGLALVLFAALFVIVLFTGPQLSSLGLPPVSPLSSFAEVQTVVRGQKLAVNIPYRIPKPTAPLTYTRSASPVLHPRPAARVVAGAPLVWGFYVNWDPNSIVSLRLHLHHLTHLVPEWFTLRNARGDIDDATDPTVVAIARQAGMPVVALLTNYREGWKPGDVSRILNNARRRRRLIENIEGNLAEHHFAGINIDFEDLKKRDREPLVQFMRELAATLHKGGYLVSQDVPVDDDNYDLKKLGEINDYLVPMIYDEHYQSGPPGPVASQAFFENELEKVGKLVAPSKVIAGFGNYGYDWVIGGQGGAEVTFDDVMAVAVEAKSPVVWEQSVSNPVLRYSTNGKRHEMWFLDAVTALNQIIAVSDGDFRGVGLWRLGAEDPGLWDVLAREKWPADDFKTRPLETMEASQQAPRHYGGSGEVLRVAETPHAGARRMVTPPHPQDDFTEEYTKYPTPYVVEHSGATDEKVLCLTFDDGPDARFTPQILDILKEKKVPATFFVIGANAESFPGLLRREYAEGHEIGNHTYTHPNVALISEERTELELGTTQRIIENLLGVSTTFFRPPYNADSEPQTPEELLPIQRAQVRGYATVAETIDPRDWEPGITAEGITKEIDAEIGGGGHVILLHDAGGDRSATVQALAQVIDRYSKRGYRFATISSLLGKTRAEAMPPPSRKEMGLARLEGGTLGLEARFLQVLGILFLGAIYLTLARSVLYGILAVWQKRRETGRKYPVFRPPVSVIVAAYNEETVIVRTVESILASVYPELEVIVVDDGSKDRTLDVLTERFSGAGNVRILSQSNAGKSAALNNAIRHAKHKILIAVDADTLFRPDAIEKLARHFLDPKVGAVSGNARVGNRKKWITRFQSMEYVYGFNLDRRALDLINAITVVPGAIGAWRRSLVEKAGGFGHDTLAEDADLTMAIRRGGSIIRYEQDAIAYTEAPEDTASLLKQRFRWSFGTLQAAWKHRDALFARKYGTLGFVALPSIWVFQVLLATLSPFAEVAMIVALSTGNWRTVLVYYFAFFLFELLTGRLAYALEGMPPDDLWLLFFQRIYYRQMMLYVLARSLLFAVRGRLVGWGKLERKATVTSTT